MLALCSFAVLLVIGIVSNGAVIVKKTVQLPTALFPPAQEATYIPPRGKRFEPDLTELVLLAGDADSDIAITDKARLEIGYEAGIKLVDVAPKNKIYTDHAWTYKKGTHCIAAFSGTNDPEDSIESASGVIGTEVNLAPRCGFNINKGIAEELDGYKLGSNWTQFINYLNDPQCEMVSAIGHSLGGSMASIFAACANSGEAGFGRRRDFGLITFGSFPVSVEPLYSGTPGTPFRGTRYHISGLDGGLNERDSLPAQTKSLRLDILKFYTALSELYGIRAVVMGLRHKSDTISALPDDEVEKFWNDHHIARQLLPMWLRIHEVYLGETDEPNLLSLQPFLRELMLNMTQRGDISYYFDPVSSWMTMYGYKHALVDYQPISNRLLDDVILTRVPAIEAPMYPKLDPFLSLIGSMLVEPKLPNHGNCCYYRGEDCLHHYEEGEARIFMSCGIVLFR